MQLRWGYVFACHLYAAEADRIGAHAAPMQVLPTDCIHDRERSIAMERGTAECVCRAGGAEHTCSMCQSKCIRASLRDCTKPRSAPPGCVAIPTVSPSRRRRLRCSACHALLRLNHLRYAEGWARMGNGRMQRPYWRQRLQNGNGRQCTHCWNIYLLGPASHAPTSPAHQRVIHQTLRIPW
jgi:hypothetical protein